jgi:hypothetical protein
LDRVVVFKEDVMGKILHSIPWSLALAMAQAGRTEEVLLPSFDAVRLVLESGISGAGGFSEIILSGDSETASTQSPERVEPARE